jgi:uncharacterized protein with HEPN domain
MSRPRSPDELLADMVAEGEYAISFLTGFTPDGFKADPRTVRAVVHSVQTVGEAAYQPDPAVQARVPDVPWGPIIRMRHLIVHHYAKVSLDIVWSVVTQDMPALVAAIRRLQTELAAAPVPPPAPEGSVP